MRSSSLQKVSILKTEKDCFVDVLLIFAGMYTNTSLDFPVKGQTSINNKEQLFWNETYGKVGSCLLIPALTVTKPTPAFSRSWPLPPPPVYRANDWPWTWEHLSPLNKLSKHHCNGKPMPGQYLGKPKPCGNCSFAVVTKQLHYE